MSRSSDISATQRVDALITDAWCNAELLSARADMATGSSRVAAGSTARPSDPEFSAPEARSCRARGQCAFRRTEKPLAGDDTSESGFESPIPGSVDIPDPRYRTRATCTIRAACSECHRR